MLAVATMLDNTLGALLIGTLVAACLHGLTTLQTYIYFSRSREDSTLLRSLVAFLWILDTVHIVLISHTVYTYTIIDFGNFAALPKPVWSMVAQVIVMGVSDAMVRGIFCHRIYLLSDRNCVLCGINVFLSIIMLCQNIYLCTKELELDTGSFSTFVPLFYANMSTGVAADAVIATTMTWLLMREKSNMNFRRTNHVIHTLVLYSVSTGAFATMVFLGCLISCS
ncbi:hypothetical protein L227DRAFT_358758 [Lentinus tigrinus ALCF2SS1-6]|uniref:DUF6534 domain-containing protein n=1 Tax=Lentinus tigrinus ALCF2SS1-6 TaxID=1328759 RepID=A0A5C2SK88_9APHY|nr:hypothetical protein L227DRAFT_358758 [Lentinus tigrinus ALCF2SS1-6]